MLKQLILSSTAAVLFAATPVVGANELETVTDRVSYIFGYNIGQKFRSDQVEVNVEVMAKALSDALEGRQPALTEEEMQSAMRALQDMQRAKHNEAMKVVGDANRKEGEAFLAANAKKDGVKITPSGLQYKVLTPGNGNKPNKSSQVSVHYRGTLLDGTEFDSSYRRGEPATFGVTQVIPGWTEALLLMAEGSKWEVYIPSDLAYGPAGAGGDIGPNATLVFEIELLKANAQ
ncbi:FKBP-type peptidyl-prolyl cis-trans isomerase [Pseudomaricurvus alkylphenolicus]|jgi:FKBP-type peptidyl-prolyl cis-trans isomerase FklB|uniref:FKBP-type peptidyl-prolyl cis-trans isomerase n=1 Tax=Pseudomaricurvus alkylphenolicus TaxID=1306991 RepID=UPI0014234F2E|nr:FKBP-type peptidyl-prolyl cis-trans isomerase [Pseudomaricurvus alkylphenolicus]NIB39570.1 FKBP-type peptidyl-prolyl cis-trans isomerase [Pseudomaricurvus alkylphenolicus]